MIDRIGVIYQDVISLGFLEGLKVRLGCAAEVILPPVNVGENRRMTLKQKRIACKYFLHKGANVVVRFTDADREKWQDVQRDELQGFPADFHQRMICGVVNNPEEWLALDANYLTETLQFNPELLRGDQSSGAIKNAISRSRGLDEGDRDVVRRLVADAPHAVFKRWLRDDAFRRFYQDCQGLASRLECRPLLTNEL